MIVISFLMRNPMMGNKEAGTMIGVYASDYLHLTEIVVLYNICAMWHILTILMKN